MFGQNEKGKTRVLNRVFDDGKTRRVWRFTVELTRTGRERVHVRLDPKKGQETQLELPLPAPVA